MKSFIRTSFLWTTAILLILLSGCTESVNSIEATSTQVFPAKTERSLPSPTTESPKITDISINGQPDDWSDRGLPVSDPTGDQTNGFLDITGGYAFVNQDAIYLMLEIADLTAPYVLFDINFVADGKPLQITWQPGQTSMRVVDWSAGEGRRLGITANTKVVFRAVLEARIDLDDLQNPDLIKKISIMVMADVKGQGWSAVDTWQIEPTLVDEKDTPHISSNEDKYYYARYWNLPEGYVGEGLLQALIANNAYITRSENGTIYCQSFGAKPQVILIDPINGEVTSILTLPAHIGLGRIFGGPSNSAFISVETEVWQIFPDGSHETIGDFPAGFARNYTPDGRFLAISFDGTTLMEWTPGGATQTIASGFQGLFDVVTRQDGTIFVYETGTGNTTRLNVDGSQKILVANRTPGEHFAIGLDADDNLFGSFGYPAFTQIDPDNGQLKILPNVFSPCAFNLGGFTITDNGIVILTGDQLVWADLKTEENGILIHNPAVTFAADIGPDDALYIGSPGCGDQFPGRILRIEDGAQSIYLDGIRDTIDSLAFGPDGSLYVASRDDSGNHLFYQSSASDKLIEILGAPQGDRLSLSVHPIRQTLFISRTGGLPILEFNLDGQIAQYPFPFEEGLNEVRIDFAPDGTFYAYVSAPTDWQAGYTDRWILRLDLENSASEIVASVPRTEPGGTMNAFTVDPQGWIWFYTNPDSNLYRISPDGIVSLFAQNLPIDAPAIAVNSQSTIYFTSASGVFHMYKEP